MPTNQLPSNVTHKQYKNSTPYETLTFKMSSRSDQVSDYKTGQKEAIPQVGISHNPKTISKTKQQNTSCLHEQMKLRINHLANSIRHRKNVLRKPDLR